MQYLRHGSIGRMDPDTRTSAAIAQDLRQLGLRSGDLVMVHASLRRIGPVRGRAEGVIEAILAAIGPGGTMLMVLGAADDHAWVNEHPEAERAALLADAVPFDALTHAGRAGRGHARRGLPHLSRARS